MTAAMPRASEVLATPMTTAHSPAGSRLPDYEPPTHPLNVKAQRALQELIRNNNHAKLRRHFDEAADLIAANALDVNAALSQRQAYVERVKAKAQQDGGEAEDARSAELEQHLEETRARAEKLTQKMEESIRKIIDSEHSAGSMEDGLKSVAAAAVTSSQRIAQTQRSTQRGSQVTNAAAVTAEPEDEEMSGFDPTDPGATARGNAGEPSFNLKGAFTSHLEQERDRYQSHSLSSRYASNNRYAQFKASVHDGLHGEDGPPLPHKSTWFKEGKEPAPGETATGGEDSDDDIAVARERISTKCPLTLREFEDVVTSTKCKHSFERSAILALMKEGGRGAKREVQCPVPGCDKQLTKQDLHTDAVLARRIKRIQQSRATQMMEDDLATSPMHGRSGRAQSVGSDSGEDIDDVERRTQIEAIKMEPRSSRPSLQANASAVDEDEEMEDGEEDEDEMDDDEEGDEDDDEVTDEE